MKNLIVICGPTSSGKTAMAHKLALQIFGEIVNADAMQLYKEFPIITNCPDESVKNEVKYHLYNIISISEEFSVYKYCTQFINVIPEIIKRDKIPIIVSGSGFYLHAVMFGYYEIPQISIETISRVKYDFSKYSLETIYNKLLSHDKRFVKYNVNDKYRIQRAYEIFIHTGESIFSFYKEENFIVPLQNFKKKIFVISPPRSYLHNKILQRIHCMLQEGAINEVQKILDWDNNTQSANAQKIIGVKEIARYLQNEIDISCLLEQIFIRTRQYAKRQNSWFKNKMVNSDHVDRNCELHVLSNESDLKKFF